MNVIQFVHPTRRLDDVTGYWIDSGTKPMTYKKDMRMIQVNVYNKLRKAS